MRCAMLVVNNNKKYMYTTDIEEALPCLALQKIMIPFSGGVADTLLSTLQHVKCFNKMLIG